MVSRFVNAWLDIYKNSLILDFMKVVTHLPVKEVLKMSLRTHEGAKVKAPNGRSYVVSNLKSFAIHGCKCVRCGREGNKVVVWIDNGGGQHIDLFCGNVLMNRDHIIPKSKKGPNSEWNYQTMCIKCNCRKGNQETQEDIVLSQFRNHWRKIHMSLYESYWKYIPRSLRMNSTTTLFIKFRERHMHKFSLFLAKLTHAFV